MKLEHYKECEIRARLILTELSSLGFSEIDSGISHLYTSSLLEFSRVFLSIFHYSEVLFSFILNEWLHLCLGSLLSPSQRLRFFLCF